MTVWDKFFDDKIKVIAKEKNILDIGGGLRFQKGLKKYESIFNNCNYKSLDVDAGTHPDIVGDIHNLNQVDESFDAVICKAVLEHVYDPQKACNEIYRVLKRGGKCLVYVPFLYGYHGNSSYKDYYRYTEDGIRYLFRSFSFIEVCPVRGNMETVLNLVPFKLFKIFIPLARLIDKYLSFKQVSGYNVFLIK